MLGYGLSSMAITAKEKLSTTIISLEACQQYLRFNETLNKIHSESSEFIHLLQSSVASECEVYN